MSPVLCRPWLLLAFCAVLGSASPAHAGLFDDDEARRQVKDLTIQSNERLDTLSKGQIELFNQIQALREENSRLRGQIETLGYELEATKKRQQDYYIDLDNRLRRFETPGGNGAIAADSLSGDEAGNLPARPPVDPAAESREYEAALNLFKANKVKEAAGAFGAFVKAHPDSPLAPNAQYWLGNAHYAAHDCKRSIDAHRMLLGQWPQHAKAPDALLNIATCQQELGDAKGARATLESIPARYPGSAAADTAKQRSRR